MIWIAHSQKKKKKNTSLPHKILKNLRTRNNFVCLVFFMRPNLPLSIRRENTSAVTKKGVVETLGLILRWEMWSRPISKWYKVYCIFRMKMKQKCGHFRAKHTLTLTSTMMSIDCLNQKPDVLTFALVFKVNGLK